MSVNTTLRPMALLVLAACDTGPSKTGAEGEEESIESAQNDDTGDTGIDDSVCDDIPDAPHSIESLRGFTTSEDFVFDRDGHVISVDQVGNLVRQTKDGTTAVILPRVGEVAGMAMTIDGHVVLANVGRGTVDMVAPDGTSVTLTSGIAYPNGLTVDSEGFVYVSEHIAGRIRRIDPVSGDYDIIAEGLRNPNGLAFSPDEQVLYVNSFGGSTVHSLQRAGGDFDPPSLMSTIESGPPYVDLCDSLSEGDACYLDGTGLGACVDSVCTLQLDRDACASAIEGEACTTAHLGEPVESVCVSDDDGLFCPRVPAADVAACVDEVAWGECSPSSGGYGWCDQTWEGAFACIDWMALEDGSQASCDGLEVGDACELTYWGAPYSGTCAAGIDWGYPGPFCLGGPYLDWMYGGLDGLDVDECGNVYVTEYVTGVVYRVPEGGGTAEELFTLESEWIPNLHWGSGAGGWDADRLYVMDRMTNGMYEVDVGVGGRPVPHLQ